MKLNYKKTFLVGLAFFLISSFWVIYDAIVPLILVNKFGMNQTSSGVIMALDNVLALFMLPLFGTLSDKTKSKMGRRKPYILVGTIVACIAFMGLSFADNAQLNKLQDVTYGTPSAQATLFEEAEKNSYTIANGEMTIGKLSAFSENGKEVKEIPVVDYVTYIYYNQTGATTRGAVKYSSLTATEQAEVKEFYCNISGDMCYFYNYESGEYRIFADTADKTASEQAKAAQTATDGKISNLYSNIITTTRTNYAWQKTVESPITLVFFIVILLVVLVAMSTFRSPAVALMPDVTIKPLRSKANAIINLMGTVGGILTTVLTMNICFNISAVKNQLMSFMPLIAITVLIMVVALIAFMLTVKEPEWERDMRLESEKYGIDEKDEEVGEARKLGKAEFRSLLFILASVAFWFMGYNAVTSKYSLYAANVLHKDYGTTMIIAQMAALAAFIPAGMVASKIGRKKTIMGGIVLLTFSFVMASFMNSNSSVLVMNILFILAGIAWASINVNSLPMVVELATGADVGKYTGFYYTASMAAQTITPIFSGSLMDGFKTMEVLFPYATIFVALSFVTMLFVKHGDSKPEAPKGVMESIGDAD